MRFSPKFVFHVAQLIRHHIQTLRKSQRIQESSALLFRNALRDAFLRNDLYNFHNFLQHMGIGTSTISDRTVIDVSRATYRHLVHENQAYRPLQLRFHIVNGITRLDIERNGLHATTQKEVSNPARCPSETLSRSSTFPDSTSPRGILCRSQQQLTLNRQSHS